MKCPCKDCICFPICKNKTYLRLFSECKLLQEYEPKYKLIDERNPSRIVELEKILLPSQWRTQKNKKGMHVNEFVYVLWKG